MHQILTYGPNRQRWGEEQKEPVHVRVNMPIEYALVTQAATTRDLDEGAHAAAARVLTLDRRHPGVLVPTKCLVKYLQGEIPTLNMDSEIPLMVNKPRAIEFYGQHFPRGTAG